ncbi:MAG: hypothetical protein WC566_03220 [Dehalococcoidia bacterium]
MDSNVERFKRLMEDGYRILGIKMKFAKHNEQDTLEIDVTLKRGENTETVYSINSSEFLDYVNHFKKVKDKYDNDEFIYINDLSRYDSLMNQYHNQPVLSEHHQLRISGREFSKGIMTLYFRPAGVDNKQGLASFWIDLAQNPDFRNVDFKDEVEIYDRSHNIVLRGFAKNYESSDQTGFILVQDSSLKMEHERKSVEFIKMNTTDCVGLLAESCGFNFKPHGIPYNTDERDFIIIMPVQNLIIDRNFVIGNVEFYQDFNDLDDFLIRKSGTGRNNSLWNGNFPRAKVTIKARQFNEAIIGGYGIIAKAIDIIALRTDISFASPVINDDTNIFGFSYYKYLSRVKIPTWVYCREKDSEAHTLFNIESLIENTLALDIDPRGYFDDINSLCSDLMVKENISVDEMNILHALHWLRKSIQEGSNKDKFIDLWIAFEFLLSGTKSKKLFTNDQISELQRVIDNLDENSYVRTQKDAIKSKIEMLNDSPLMEKFNQLKFELGVDLSEWEIGILKTARRKRANLFHGRGDVEIKEGDLNKMRTILEKMLISFVKCSYSERQQ